MIRYDQLVSLACITVLLGALALAQAPASFDVVSIKPNVSDPSPLRNVIWQPGGQMRATGLTLRDLIRSAYVQEGIQLPEQIVGGPEWLDRQRFDVIARAPATPSGEPTTEHRAGMLKALLADRFALRFHRESRALPGFDLVLASDVGRLGPQLVPSTCTRIATPGARPCAPTRMVGMDPAKGVTMAFEGMTMAEFASALVSFPDIGRPIRDRTGLEGLFDIQLTLPVGAARGIAGPPTTTDALIDTGVRTMLQEQLGLKLEGRRTEVDVLVIDSAQLPTEN